MNATVPTVYSTIPSLPEDDDEDTPFLQDQITSGYRNRERHPYHNYPATTDANFADEKALPADYIHPTPRSPFIHMVIRELFTRETIENIFTKPPNLGIRAFGLTYIALSYGATFLLISPEKTVLAEFIPAAIIFNYIIAILKLFLWNRHDDAMKVYMQYVAYVPISVLVGNWVL
ncbi:hypothetical protein TWF481_010718 [Arthrobotrys musiformis]|uniref:Uncharacterized protein n=1 Tax=Arthrobotrys musiformis TaxID=47236 RepID=A0AAV9W2Z3_9PEZI